MNRLVILISTLIIFIGCGNESSNTDTTQMAKNILTEETYSDDNKIATYAKYFEKIDNQKDLKQFFKKNNNAPLIDFNKSYVLAYYTKYNAIHQLDEYREEISLEDNESIKIEQIFTGNKRDYYGGRAVQLRLYSVSKKIKNIEMIHEDERTKMDINNLNPKDSRVSNFFVNARSPVSEEMIKVFDDNNSYQTFVDDLYQTTLQEFPHKKHPTKSIDFEHNRVLLRVKYVSYDDLYRYEENILFPTASTAKIVDTFIRPHYMTEERTSPADEYDIFIYTVDRSIETVEIKYDDEESVEVDMRE